MTFTIRPATVRDACFVAANMRVQDWREISAVVGDIPRTHAAIMMLESSLRPDGDRLAWQVSEDGDPVAVWGVSYVFPHIAAAWAYGTDQTIRAIPSLSGWSAEHWPPLFDLYGLQRVEIRTIEDHDLSHRWLKAAGATFETKLPNYGRHGETFDLYSWTRGGMAGWSDLSWRRLGWRNYTDFLAA